MKLLIFQLAGALAGFGEVAIGETRGTLDAPSYTHIFGLIAAALGLQRDQEAELLALQGRCRLVVGTIQTGHLLRDYHTAQVAGQSDLKKRPLRTRADELNLPRHQLNTILSTRDYRSDGAWLVALGVLNDQSETLERIAQALKTPQYTLFLGRKSCPLSRPTFPMVVDSPTVLLGMQDYLLKLGEKEQAWNDSKVSTRLYVYDKTYVSQLSWDDQWNTDEVGVSQALFQTRQQDVLLSRKRWQYAPRTLYVANIDKPTMSLEA